MKKLTKVLISGSLLSLVIPVMAGSTWLVRLREIGVLPSASSSSISLIGGETFVRCRLSNELVL